MATFGTASTAAAAGAAGKTSPWFTIEGVVLIVLGVLAFIAPFAAGAATVSILGVLIFLGGVFGLVSTFSGGRHTHRTWSLVSAIVAIVAGLIVALFPLAGAVVLTTIIAAYLVFDGVSMIMLSRDHKKRHTNWGWLMAAGVADIVLGVLVFFLNPLGAAILIGVIVAIDLILAGVALIGAGRGRPVAIPSPI